MPSLNAYGDRSSRSGEAAMHDTGEAAREQGKGKKAFAGTIPESENSEPVRRGGFRKIWVFRKCGDHFPRTHAPCAKKPTNFAAASDFPAGFATKKKEKKN